MIVSNAAPILDGMIRGAIAMSAPKDWGVPQFDQKDGTTYVKFIVPDYGGAEVPYSMFNVPDEAIANMDLAESYAGSVIESIREGTQA